MRIFAKICSAIALFVSIAAILIAGIFTIPKFFGVMPYIVESGSMEPVIHTGAVAFIDTHDRNVSVGDVITYKIGGEDTSKFVTHRVIREEPDGLVTQGDANDVEDANHVSESQVIGTYRFSIPYAGRLFAQKSKITLVMVFWVVLMNLMSLVISWLANASKNEELAESGADGSTEQKKE